MLTYTNPILAGFYPDPSICRVEDDYYLACSSFAYFPGIPLFHSRDLVHWRLLTHVLDRPSQFDPEGLGVSKGVFAPTIRYHQGIFYLTCTLVDAGGNFLVTATDPAGPWSDPVWLPINGIDPSLFFDDDGQAWLVYNSLPPDDRPLYNGHRTIRRRGFDHTRMKLLDDECILINGGTDLALRPRWIEGPHLYKRNNWYYLLAAEGGTGYDHAVVVFRSRSIDGPFLPDANNPLLGGDRGNVRAWPITSAGHADLVDTPAGDWQAVFLACRPYRHDHYNTGRETFLVPVAWEADWPVFNPGKKWIEYRYPQPLPPADENQAPYSGNFEWTDQFDGSTLHPDWLFLRLPRPEHYDLHRRPGQLSLRLAPDSLDGRGRPSFLGRRQQHLHARARLLMSFEPGAEGELAGLVVFQDSHHFYFLAIAGGEAGREVRLYRSILVPREEGQLELLAKASVSSGRMELEAEARGASYVFAYRTAAGPWLRIGPALPADFLSTCTAGGFTGCVLGIYATSSGAPCEAHAFIHRFAYRGTDPAWSGS